MPQFPAKARLFSTDQYSITLPQGHKFPVSKYGLLRSALQDEGKFQLEMSPFADLPTLALAHDPAYVHDFVDGRLAHSAMRRIGLPWSELLVKRALASVGGTVSASLDAISTG
ncbi:MAG TPA: histone deacetylase, partial [Terriglobales bacterium]|nr:histone deacetylase [Terriglobales bacterium]